MSKKITLQEAARLARQTLEKIEKAEKEEKQKEAHKGKIKITNEMLASVCLSYDHSYGLMDLNEQENFKFYAKEWLIAWAKELDLNIKFEK